LDDPIASNDKEVDPMARGEVHAQDCLWIAVLGGAGVGFSQGVVPGLSFSIGALLGVFMSPDLDLDATWGRRLLLNWAYPVGVGWSLLWWPYTKLVAHRSLISHVPVGGSLLRVAYLLAPWVLTRWLLEEPIDWELWVKWGAWPLLGLVLSDMVHWLRDGCPL
jgi:uncharacterized metal-binding protein